MGLMTDSIWFADGGGKQQIQNSACRTDVLTRDSQQE